MDERTERNKAWCNKLILGWVNCCDDCECTKPCYDEEVHEEYQQYKTVEEIEAVRCSKCSRTGHWGWCDDPITICSAKTRIKEILGIPQDKHRMTALESITKVLDKAGIKE